ncbi:MAG: type II toxin-antitoxin system RelE/ParE family toxin [Planctomycetaceae bacterium]|nr:type II toxin-antitoxin system RelE/ParE family toxin [Planctomycetaceae bacterium]
MSRPKKRPASVILALTRRALADLREIERYSVKEWGRKAADQYLDEIEAALNRLRENPTILQMEPEFSPGLWFYRVQKHVLACDLNKNQILVLTVLHTSMDLPARLQELEPRLMAEAAWLREKLRS